MKMRMTKKLRGAIVAPILWTLSALPALADVTTLKVGVNQIMNAQLMTPEGPGPYPALLLLHTSGGLQTEDLDYAKRLVTEGYVVLVPSFLEAYGIRAKTRQSSFTTYAEPIYADFVASLEKLQRNPKVNAQKLGAIGFSNGGYFALWLAANRQIQAGVSYYGALTGAGTDKSLTRYRQTFTSASSPVLVLHGSDDTTVPVLKAIELDQVLTQTQTQHTFAQYAGAEHRFERDHSASNDAAADDAWQRTRAFLKLHLKD
jgi:carboxymethylenebutenolidase